MQKGEHGQIEDFGMQVWKQLCGWVRGEKT